MATEIELKLRLTAETAKQLASHPLLRDIPVSKLHLLNTYYDTPDLELHKRRIALRFRKKGEQWLLTVKSSEAASGGLAVRSEWETPAEPGVFNFTHVDDADLRQFLSDNLDTLHPIFTTDFRRSVWQVPFGESLIELAVDRGSIASKGEKRPICEMELELLSGQLDDIFGLTKALQKDFSLHPAIESKAERGYGLYLAEKHQPFHAKAALITAAHSPIDAFRQIALACLEHFQRNESGLKESKAPEFVHQARVALRRLSSAIELFRPVLPVDFAVNYEKIWKSLGSALGAARDRDVFLSETLPPLLTAFPKERSLIRLQTRSQLQARHTRREIAQHFLQTDYPKLLVNFTADLYALRDTSKQEMSALAQMQLSTLEKAALRRAKKYATLEPAQLHKLRIRIKKLRYAMEFFAPLFPATANKIYLSKLARLQSLLGNINDLVTARSLIIETLKNHPPGIVEGWLASRHSLLCEQLAGPLKAWGDEACFVTD